VVFALILVVKSKRIVVVLKESKVGLKRTVLLLGLSDETGAILILRRDSFTFGVEPRRVDDRRWYV